MDHEETVHCFVSETEKERIDVYLAEMLNKTRSYVQNLIEQGNVTVNGKQVKSNYKLKRSDEIRTVIPKPTETEITAQDIPLDIVYEDEYLLVVNKAKGMVVHPAAGNPDGTLVNALLYRTELSGINGELRPGIVHRIDKDTSGLMVVAKCDEAHQILSDMMKVHDVRRTYLALVQGVIKLDGTVNANIDRNPKDRKKMAVVGTGGRTAITHYHVLRNFGQEATLLRVQLETGRTHQIRVHMKHIGHPIMGDTVYGAKIAYGLTSQALHAYRIFFLHPITKETMEFTAKPPESFLHALFTLQKKYKNR